MARKKTIEAVDSEISKIKSDMSKLQECYDKLAEKLEDLQNQKRRIEADTIMEAYLKSGKNFDEIYDIFESMMAFSVTFLQSSQL